MSKVKTSEVLDILDRLQFFEGQRAGRELWLEKPPVIQEQDLYNFNNDIDRIRKHIRNLEKKLDADGCCGCAFEDVNSWEMPCAACSRNCKDYWRAKKVEELLKQNAENTKNVVIAR